MIIQLVVANDTLFALDSDGNIWVIDHEKMASNPDHSVEVDKVASLKPQVVTPLPPDKLYKVMGLVSPKVPRQVAVERKQRLGESPDE